MYYNNSWIVGFETKFSMCCVSIHFKTDQAVQQWMASWLKQLAGSSGSPNVAVTLSRARYIHSTETNQTYCILNIGLGLLAGDQNNQHGSIPRSNLSFTTWASRIFRPVNFNGLLSHPGSPAHYSRLLWPDATGPVSPKFKKASSPTTQAMGMTRGGGGGNGVIAVPFGWNNHLLSHVCTCLSQYPDK